MSGHRAKWLRKQVRASMEQNGVDKRNFMSIYRKVKKMYTRGQSGV